MGGASSANPDRGNFAEARRRMREAGVDPPRACSCTNPAHTTDYDGLTTCIYCGRNPRDLA